MGYRSFQDESASDRLTRARLAKIFLTMPVLLLLTAYFRYQVLHTSEYTLHSEENRLKRVEQPPPRGLLTDRNGQVLAENVPAYSIEFYPQPLDSMRLALERIAPVIGLDTLQQRELLEKFRYRRQQPLQVATSVNDTTLAVVEEHRSEFPGIFIRSDMKRSYVYGEMLAHVLGYVGEITENELNSERYLGYTMGALVGRSGIEAQYEQQLQGRRGVKFIEVDARGRELGPFRDRPPIPPQRGQDLQLTIDIRLQQAACEAMKDIERGALVVLQPYTGEVLAMVSKPVYDPNRLTSGVTGAQWRELLFHPNKPFLNRAIQGVYPPGSTFKPFTALVGAELGFVHPPHGAGMEVGCRGGLQFGRRFFRCWRPGGHGSVGLPEAIEQSCDTFFYQMGIRIGLDKFCQFGKESGFFDRTGIDLPDEQPGVIPDEAWYNRSYGRGGWGPGNVLNLSIGQGEISLSPLQLAVLYSFLASGGQRHRPHLLMGDAQRYELPNTVFKPENVEMLREPLTAVVNGPSGTARASQLWGHGFKLAGKTGTSQNPHGDDHGLFCGFYPAHAPELVVTIVGEHTLHGSSMAPLARILVQAYIDNYEAPAAPPEPVALNAEPAPRQPQE